MIFVEDYGDLSKYANNYADYSKFIGRHITVYTAAGTSFSGILCIDGGEQIMLISGSSRSQSSRQASVIIFKRHIAAIEIPVSEQ